MFIHGSLLRPALVASLAASLLPAHETLASDAPSSLLLTGLSDGGRAATRLIVREASFIPQPTAEGPTSDALSGDPPADEPETGRGTPGSDDKRFGREGTRWLTVGTGAATNFDDAIDSNLHVAYSLFLIDRVEWAVELGGWHFNQTGNNALGLNLSTVFRWHFYCTEDWSVYADTGIGVLVVTDNVPQDGTGFDLTPRAGVGFTRRLTDGGVRLQAGLRWHHISNARVTGETRNPSRDGVMLYVGVVFPF